MSLIDQSSQSGATLTEYVVGLSLILMVTLAGIAAFQYEMMGKWCDASTVFEDDNNASHLLTDGEGLSRTYMCFVEDHSCTAYGGFIDVWEEC